MSKKILLRIVFLVVLMGAPVVFGWWLFVPLALIYVYLVHEPYEVLLCGVLLDNIYSFDGNILEKHILAIFALILILITLLLETRVDWKKIV